ncbi:putative rhodanese-related sulfur transferase [Fictibacillus macauensis ZFHKF-1]|uniref:Putative rhodanese-related sulfur transferase n=1 Tax=Fictibacillus macauensis ZFHKF-1 TaxID=1196324 RepID=I8UIJ5_9BACL|nr:sulfurtransferase TusA family protein [Fictibacillus macauensis]EIT86715.1 putative rhodanese-related sulfur transferase [Fictibacillus macauensis ZFHKF-1]
MKADSVVDAKGLACPMPIVKTKKKMKEVDEGHILEILATDKGSTADLKAWAKSTGHEYLGLESQGEVLHHFLRKGGASSEQKGQQIPVQPLEQFQHMVLTNALDGLILDVREEDEYKAGHIPGALHIALDKIESRAVELSKTQPIYLICHSGRRSEVAGQQLKDQGFTKLWNVVPGMMHYAGVIEKKGE